MRKKIAAAALAFVLAASGAAHAAGPRMDDNGLFSQIAGWFSTLSAWSSSDRSLGMDPNG